MNSKKNIKESLRKMLLEKDGETFNYGCVMLSLNISSNKWDKIQDMIDDEDIYTKEGDRSYGREDNPHITILYGLHADVPDEKIEDIIKKIKKVEVKLKKITIFEVDDFDVVKFEIIGDTKSALNKMNAEFIKLPHTTDFPDYKPHSTIAYVKSGAGKKYVKSLDDEIVLTPTEILYSKADGSETKYKIKTDED